MEELSDKLDNRYTVRMNGQIRIALDYYMEHENVNQSEAIRNLLLLGFTAYYSYTTDPQE